MALTFTWNKDHGVATGSPTKGTTRATTVTDNNWKNSDVETDVYSLFPITDVTNSFEQWSFGVISGTGNQASAGLFAHTATAFSTGLTLKGVPAGSSQVTYTTPAITANASLTIDMTAVTAITSGVAVYFGATGPEAVGKTASISTFPAYTNYLTTQLQVSGAAAGDTAQVTLSLRYNEN